MSALKKLLDTYRQSAASEREKGTYFEELIVCYLRNEATYRDLYSDVWTYAQWSEIQGLDKRDAGIDLVAKTQGTGEYHAIQCKLYAEDYKLQKGDIDSFFTASGKRPFTHRVIVSTTNLWSHHAEDALRDQQPPVSKIDLNDLENSQIDWAQYQPKTTAAVLKSKKTLRPHQASAQRATLAGFEHDNRGKLIMACGTGKTFTSLKIAEGQAGKGKRVLFLVPSLSLLSQTLTEWTQESETPLHSFAVCSDSDVGKKRKQDDDTVQTFTHELRYPATTEPARLATEMAKRHDSEHMSVVFSTYHSIDVISRAQHEHGLADFDLVICDEAHRTTGATFGDDDESNFVKVHDGDYLRAAKRLYMTATPRIYGETAKATAEKDSVALCSMDDPALYGPEFFVITFSEAVKRGLLVDYKVIVLAVEETHVSRRIQKLLSDGDNQLKVDDAAKIVGCWKALAKQGLAEELNGDANPMKRAVAFCQVIDPNPKAKSHKVSSRNIANMFQAVVEAYQASETDEDASNLACEAEHVDGGMNATAKEAKLSWLKAETPPDTCRILSNVRCLSEGVDVPALDAVLFLTPRNSQVDVVQSVGRVMRNAPGKNRGYVVLPVVIPAGMEAHEALNDNQTYKVVWQVLQALRSHDDRFDAMVNKLDLIGRDTSKMEVIAVTDKIQKKAKKPGAGATGDKAQRDKLIRKAKGGQSIGNPDDPRIPNAAQAEIEFEIGEIEKAIYAKLVQKVGNRHHWEDWANDIAKIARTHIDRITAILENPENTNERTAFEKFAGELRDDLNNSITDGEIIEMLAQHLITKPVFEALFADYSFAEHNPMSQAMQGVLDALEAHRLDKEADTLQAFYESVKQRAEGIENAAGKQKIIVELYEKFFANAFPKLKDKLGIVYTPVAVVDFIIHSVNDILKAEFGVTLGDKGVHIIDPFTGTGTFITRLLQSGLITPVQLAHKYKYEIHANELVLLAYYIAAINIEAVYHSLAGGKYTPFEGICLTDTFQMYEKEDLVNEILVDNSERRRRQKKLDIRVILGNPPYSSGQGNANDNNQNIDYPHLDSRIRKTYAEKSKAILKNSLYDSYIRAIRWASDRIVGSGIIGYVSGSGFIEKPAMDGLRKCLAEEFTNIHIINLRGDIRKNMLSKGRAKEGQNIFGSNSMTGIAVTFFVKNELSNKGGQISYYDIGDDLSQDEKLSRLQQFGSKKGIDHSEVWRKLSPDRHGDWLNQRDDSFGDFICLGEKRSKTGIALFRNYSSGVKTNRDAWVYNFSKSNLSETMLRMISSYNDEVIRYRNRCGSSPKSEWPNVDDFINFDSMKMSWTREVKNDLGRHKKREFREAGVVPSMYRAFTKSWLYFDRNFNNCVYQMPQIFPESDSVNLVICLSGIGARSGFSVLMSKTLPDLEIIEKSQCFPLYLYEPECERDKVGDGDSGSNRSQTSLFKDEGEHAPDNSTAQAALQYTRTDAITDEGMEHFHSAYPDEALGNEDVFYYVYGLLHSPDYRERYADNLSKELPRIPCVKTAADFWAFSQAGRKLADLHVNYETVTPFPATVNGDTGSLIPAQYRVEKMKFGKQGKEKDRSTIHYNALITVSGIPLEAYDYVVNGKSAIDWVMERQCFKKDKDSGIVNDANDWAVETMGNPRYPLELLLRVITVSLETTKIVKNLPNLSI